MKYIRMTSILTAACTALLFAQDVEEVLQALETFEPVSTQTVAAAPAAPAPSPAKIPALTDLSADLSSIALATEEALAEAEIPAMQEIGTEEEVLTETEVPTPPADTPAVLEKTPVVLTEEEASAEEDLSSSLSADSPSIALATEEASAEAETPAEEETVADIMEELIQPEEISADLSDTSDVSDASAAPEETTVEIEPDADVSDAPAEAEKTDEISMNDEAVTGSEMEDTRISLTLKDVTLQEVVRLFTRLSNANIIVPDLAEGEEVERRIDVNLNDVEWKPALQAILETQGMELYEKIPGTEVYGIRNKIPDAPEPMEVQVFKLDYATVSSVTNMMSGLVGDGQISAFPARNVIVVKGTAKILSDLEGIVERIDLPREQVFIEAKFMELSDSASDQLGIDWQVLGGYGVSAGPLGGNYSRTDTDTRTSSDHQTADTDDPPAIYETPAGSALFQPFISPEFSQTLESQTVTALLNADKFNLVLAALKEINGAKIVSNPKVIVANEETAMIHIGNKKPNVKGSIQTAGDSQVNRTYGLDENEPYFEDGIKVNVTPTVNTASNITVNIQPTLDRLDGIPTMAPDGTLFYGKSTKTINTVFSLESGQTAAIGGLTQTSSDNVDRKIPVLGSIPLLGRFFSYEQTIDSQTETIIFVTVGLANPDRITMETGLPEDASLARRYRLTSGTDRAVEREKIKTLETQEQERLEEMVNAVRNAESNRLSKKQ